MYGHVAKLAEAEKKGIEEAGGSADVFQYVRQPTLFPSSTLCPTPSSPENVLLPTYSSTNPILIPATKTSSL